MQTDNPGGMECEECGVIFVGSTTHALCNICNAHMLLSLPENRGLAARIDNFIESEYRPTQADGEGKS